MLADFWNWLLKTDQGLGVRIAIGAAIFTVLALLDIRRKGLAARRWREYLFLLSVVAVTMLYGTINDQVTCTISPIYFANHDDQIGSALRDHLDDQALLRWEAFKLGLKATWSAGLVIGVALLLANNPGKRPQMPYRRLYRTLLFPLSLAAGLSVVLGVAGIDGWLDWLLGEYGQFAPWWGKFACVYGIHLGAYAGGILGTICAVVSIRRARTRLAAPTPEQPAQ